MPETNAPDNRIRKTGKPLFDYTFLALILFLISFGLIMLYSTSYYSAEQKFGNGMYFFIRQAFFSVVSFVSMMIVSKIDYHTFLKLSKPILYTSWVLMMLVRFTPLGVESYGARRWLAVPLIGTIQPSEITKIAIILFIPWWIKKIGKEFYTFPGVAKTFGWAAATALLTFTMTDHLSGAIIILGITYVIVYVAHRWSKLFAVLAVGGIALLYFLARVLAGALESSNNFRIARLLAWYNPDGHMQDGGYQILQGLYAIGSGGFFGKGLGNSSQKLGFIPEAQNDMILSILCEELGVFGLILLLLLFGLLLYHLLQIAKHAPDLEGALIVTGVFAHIALQVILNLCVILNLIPTTGITVPFISYGGSAIVFLMVEMGLALGVADRSWTAGQ